MRFDSNDWSALGSVVNAVVVIVLAILNFLYFRSAKRQAHAAEQQAEAALRTLELVTRGHLLERQRDAQRVGIVLREISSAITAFEENAEKGLRWDGQLAPKDFGEIRLLFDSLYPDLKADFKEFLSLLGHLAKANEISHERNQGGGWAHEAAPVYVRGSASEANQKLAYIFGRIRTKYPELQILSF